MLDNQQNHGCRPSGHMRLTLNFMTIKNFHRDRVQIHRLSIVSHDQRAVLGGSLVPNTIDKDYDKSNVDPMVKQQG